MTKRLSDETKISVVLTEDDMLNGQSEAPHPDRVHAKNIREMVDKKFSFTFYLSAVVEFD